MRQLGFPQKSNGSVRSDTTEQNDSHGDIAFFLQTLLETTKNQWYDRNNVSQLHDNNQE